MYVNIIMMIMMTMMDSNFSKEVRVTTNDMLL